MVGAEQVDPAAAVLPGRRAEAARQAADLRIVRCQHVGEDGDEGDEQEDQHRDQRKALHPPEGGRRPGREAVTATVAISEGM
jgi:hypothetical protein